MDSAPQHAKKRFVEGMWRWVADDGTVGAPCPEPTAQEREEMKRSPEPEVAIRAAPPDPGTRPHGSPRASVKRTLGVGVVVILAAFVAGIAVESPRLGVAIGLLLAVAGAVIRSNSQGVTWVKWGALAVGGVMLVAGSLSWASDLVAAREKAREAAEAARRANEQEADLALRAKTASDAISAFPVERERQEPVVLLSHCTGVPSFRLEERARARCGGASLAAAKLAMSGEHWTDALEYLRDAERFGIARDATQPLGAVAKRHVALSAVSDLLHSAEQRLEGEDWTEARSDLRSAKDRLAAASGTFGGEAPVPELSARIARLEMRIASRERGSARAAGGSYASRARGWTSQEVANVAANCRSSDHSPAACACFARSVSSNMSYSDYQAQLREGRRQLRILRGIFSELAECDESDQRKVEECVAIRRQQFYAKCVGSGDNPAACRVASESDKALGMFVPQCQALVNR